MCYYSENQVFRDATNQDMSLIEMCFYSRLYRMQDGQESQTLIQGLRTPNEGINQRYLKNWSDMADKICFFVPKNLGLGLNSRPCSEDYFLSGRP